MTTPQRPKPLLYSDYINDRAIVESLTMPPVPIGVRPEDWPALPAGWTPGDDWPAGPNWAHEEALFIRTHQAFEVWFALILHELSSVVREAVELLGNGAGLPRVDFASRDTTAGGEPIAGGGGHWPKTAAAIASAVAADPAAAGPLASLRAPARFGVGAQLAAGLGETDAFNHALARWTRRVRRAAAAMLSTIPFFDVLATMTPAEFLQFRGRLQPASGFGSVQFRELELLLGLRELHEKKLRPEGGTPEGEAGREPLPAGMLRPTSSTPSDQAASCFYAAQPPWGWGRVARRYRETSLRDVIYAVLSAAYAAGSREQGPERGLPDLRGPALDVFLAGTLEQMIRDHYRGLSAGKLDDAGLRQLAGGVAALDAGLAHQETIVAAFIDMHPAQERLSLFLEACIEMDGAVLKWRDRHIRFVEFMIGMRRGTGGGGIAYLRTTVAPKAPVDGPQFTHAFPCLWQARSFVQRR